MRIDASIFDPEPQSTFNLADYHARIEAALFGNAERQAKKRESEQRAASHVGRGSTRFTTDYAIAWGRRQGWKLVDRESYDYRMKRHHDCQLGMDALFDDGEGLVGVQGAGRSERKIHRERFDSAGGAVVAKARHIRIFYLEFDRGNQEPALEEIWA